MSLLSQEENEAIMIIRGTPLWPYFKAIAKAYKANFRSKGTSWKRCSLDHLWEGISKQIGDIEDRTDDEEDFVANIGVYAAFIWLHENGKVKI